VLHVVPPTITFKGKAHIEGWFEELGLSGDWRIELRANNSPVASEVLYSSYNYLRCAYIKGASGLSFVDLLSFMTARGRQEGKK
jgi:hypothetical protein